MPPKPQPLIEKDELPQILRAILDDLGLTVYGGAMLIAAETDEPLKTAHERLSRLLKRSPQSWVQIQQALGILGYQIKIEKK